jgi:hypothetical protein
MSPATIVLGGVVAMTVAVCGVGALAMATSITEPGCTPSDSAVESQWTSEQLANATTIVTVGARMRVPTYGWVIAVATAMQESGLRNLGDLGPANDHDSLGLFQQRPSQGWGTPAQVMDPAYAATRFYEKLLHVDGWQQMPLTVAAQRVQVSAYPDAYAKHETNARNIVNLVATQLGLSLDCTGEWVDPLPPGSYQLTSPFGPRWGSHHDGQDFAASTGTPIRAAASGIVLSAGCTSPFCDRPGDVDAAGRPVTPGCGLRIVLLHPGDVTTVYCHALSIAVRTGQYVIAGQLVGRVGSTGNSTGSHLHFEVRLNGPPVETSTAVDPALYLRARRVSI